MDIWPHILCIHMIDYMHPRSFRPPPKKLPARATHYTEPSSSNPDRPFENEPLCTPNLVFAPRASRSFSNRAGRWFSVRSLTRTSRNSQASYIFSCSLVFEQRAAAKPSRCNPSNKPWCGGGVKRKKDDGCQEGKEFIKNEERKKPETDQNSL